MSKAVNCAFIHRSQFPSNTLVSLNRIPWSSPDDSTVFEVSAAQVCSLPMPQRLRQDGFLVTMDNDSIALYPLVSKLSQEIPDLCE